MENEEFYEEFGYTRYRDWEVYWGVAVVVKNEREKKVYILKDPSFPVTAEEEAEWYRKQGYSVEIILPGEELPHDIPEPLRKVLDP